MTETDLYVHEKKLYQKDIHLIAGIDEAGRGPLAGPVVAAAVILKEGAVLEGVNDSKKLSEKQREKALISIRAHALAIGIGVVDVEEIDQINIYEAAKKAMMLAVSDLEILPEYLLIDAMPLQMGIQSESIIKGDQKSVSIAAASIVAKTTRDQYMKQMAERYPLYGFEKHKGYGTKYHIEMIEMHGITPIHRKTFEPIKSMLSPKIIQKSLFD